MSDEREVSSFGFRVSGSLPASLMFFKAPSPAEFAAAEFELETRNSKLETFHSSLITVFRRPTA